MALFGDPDAAAVLARLAAAGVARGALKRGAEGPLPIGPCGALPAFPQAERVVDTTAAGDSFNGAYLAALMRGEPEAGLPRRRARDGAEVIGHPGAIMPRKDSVEPLAVPVLDRWPRPPRSARRSRHGRSASRRSSGRRRCRARPPASRGRSGSCTSGSARAPGVTVDHQHVVGQLAVDGELLAQVGVADDDRGAADPQRVGDAGDQEDQADRRVARAGCGRCRSGGCRGGRGWRACARRAP